MNQVYFYAAIGALTTGKAVPGLNPFMNQVYFYRSDVSGKSSPQSCVLIPL